MDTLESELTQEELGKVEEFYQRLKQPNLDHVKRIVNSIDTVANNYFSSGEQDRNYWAFTDENILSGVKKVGTPFFVAYLVGGYLNKEGERPDIDLLVATNMRWSNGFLNHEGGSRGPEDWDPMWAALVGEFGDGYSVQRNGDLPDDYNIGATKGKVLITITPPEGKKLDVSYVRSWQEEGFKFIDEKQFHKLDVGKTGEPLSRLPLYRATSNTSLSQMRW